MRTRRGDAGKAKVGTQIRLRLSRVGPGKAEGGYRFCLSVEWMDRARSNKWKAVEFLLEDHQVPSCMELLRTGWEPSSDFFGVVEIASEGWPTKG